MQVTLDEPVVVALSVPDEKTWGVHQFPALDRLPDGRLLLMYSDAVDALETHGRAAPAYVSSDAGASWQPHEGSPPVTRPHFAVSEVFDGDYLIASSQPYLNIDENGIVLPPPVASADVYGLVHHYQLADTDHALREYYSRLPALRWRPTYGAWEEANIEYDTDGILPWRRESSRLLSRTFFERPLMAWRDELMFADYRVRYQLQDGFVPPKAASSLMVSRDNGQSFLRRTTIAVDRSGRDMMGEPTLSPTTDGRIACALRRTDHEQKPMAITWSEDSGHTWTAPRALMDFGVFPGLLLLDNGILVLSFGRPGVWLAFAEDGAGEAWTAPQPVVAGNPADFWSLTCGYTSLLPLAPDHFLLAYSQLNHCCADGRFRKAILTRGVTVRR